MCRSYVRLPFPQCFIFKANITWLALCAEKCGQNGTMIVSFRMRQPFTHYSTTTFFYEARAWALVCARWSAGYRDSMSWFKFFLILKNKCSSRTSSVPTARKHGTRPNIGSGFFLSRDFILFDRGTVLACLIWLLGVDALIMVLFFFLFYSKLR